MWLSKQIAEKYASSMADLTVNSKPLISMLTMLAEENMDHAGAIVETVEKHLEKVHPDAKLPVLYLTDSIVKNVGGAYTEHFAQKIVKMFPGTFKTADKKVRSRMFKLRKTWRSVFPATKLYQVDVKTQLLDPAWPLQAKLGNKVRKPRIAAGPAPPVQAPVPVPPDTLDDQPLSHRE